MGEGIEMRDVDVREGNGGLSDDLEKSTAADDDVFSNCRIFHLHNRSTVSRI